MGGCHLVRIGICRPRIKYGVTPCRARGRLLFWDLQDWGALRAYWERLNAGGGGGVGEDGRIASWWVDLQKVAIVSSAKYHAF